MDKEKNLTEFKIEDIIVITSTEKILYEELSEELANKLLERTQDKEILKNYDDAEHLTTLERENIVSLEEKVAEIDKEISKLNESISKHQNLYDYSNRFLSSFSDEIPDLNNPMDKYIPDPVEPLRVNKETVEIILYDIRNILIEYLNASAKMRLNEVEKIIQIFDEMENENNNTKIKINDFNKEKYSNRNNQNLYEPIIENIEDTFTRVLGIYMDLEK